MMCFNSALCFITGRHIASCWEPALCTSCDENDLEGLRVWNDQLSVEIRIASLPGIDTLMVLRDEVGFMSFPECVWQTRYLLMNRCIETEKKIEKSY